MNDSLPCAHPPCKLRLESTREKSRETTSARSFFLPVTVGHSITAGLPARGKIAQPVTAPLASAKGQHSNPSPSSFFHALDVPLSIFHARKSSNTPNTARPQNIRRTGGTGLTITMLLPSLSSSIHHRFLSRPQPPQTPTTETHRAARKEGKKTNALQQQTTLR